MVLKYSNSRGRDRSRSLSLDAVVPLEDQEQVSGPAPQSCSIEVWHLPSLDAFRDGTSGANQWGRTSTGNLALTNGPVVIEFVIVASMPVGVLQELSAPLNTLWNSDQIGDYDSFDTDNSPVHLHFEGGVAVIADDVCGEFGFAVSIPDTAEGPISFGPPEPGFEPCEPTGDAAAVVEAFARADYFATADGVVQFWDGPVPLMAFADDEAD